MAYPTHIREALLDGESIPQTHKPLEGECQGAKFHSPTPLVLYPHGLGSGEEVLLCGTCHDNLMTFLVLTEEFGGEMPWEIRREFGNRLRALGEKQWKNESNGG